MSLAPLLEANPVIQVHAISAIFAFFIGPIIFYGRKGTRLHKLLGRLWVLSMGLAIVSSAFIWQVRLVGPFSPIHILTVLSGWGIISGVNAAIKGRIAQHEAAMKGLYFWALGAAGVFTFLPDRIMNRMFFPEHSLAGFYFVLGVYLAVLLMWKLKLVQYFTSQETGLPKM